MEGVLRDLFVCKVFAKVPLAPFTGAGPSVTADVAGRDNGPPSVAAGVCEWSGCT